MSNNRFFLDAMAHIDDSLIEDAVKDYKKPKKTFITTLSLVACFVLIIGLALPITIFRFVKTPEGNVIGEGKTEETDDTSKDKPTAPSDKNILSISLLFRNEATKSTAIVYHISDSSIRFTLLRDNEASGEIYSFMDAIKGSSEDDANPSVVITVNDQTADSLPSEEGEYRVAIDFASVSAEDKEKIIKYYFELNGYREISQN